MHTVTVQSLRSLVQTAQVLMALAAATPTIATAQIPQEPTAATAPDMASPAQPALQQRLDRLCENLDMQREALHIPGCAIAIVQNDHIILSRGFGVRDVKQNTPVTPETLFAIGSSSKAFTAALCAMMVDEGKMQWDDPVRTHLPEFRLFDKDANEQITIRDLLCHNSGLARTDLIWASGQATRQEILAAVAMAEPTAKFREKFQYQNVMFLAAGMAAANAGGLKGDWDAMVAQRIFAPLRMTSSNTTLDAAKANPQLSLGYSWNEDKKQFKHLPMRDLRGIAPAGAINSNVLDMAQWLRLQLNRGEIDRVRLISEPRFNDDMWRKQISLSGASEGGGADVNYGMGWMLHDWKGRRVVEHGGNIDGFGAQVAMLPDDHIGFVLLTNVTATPLQSMSINLVFDGLLGEWKDTVETPLDPTTVQDCFGKYHFEIQKVDCTVLMKDGKLAVDVPRQMVYTLKEPDETGKWYFELTDTIAISFQKDATGQVVSMTFHQAGMTFECPKEGATLPVEISLDDAQKYLGTYHDDEDKVDVNVIHRHGRLALDVPKQMVFDLYMPDAEGKWVFRMNDKMAVKFEQDASGSVTGMVSLRNGKQSTLPRVGDAAPAASAVKLDDVLALHAKSCGSDHVADLGGVSLSGNLDMVNQGIRDAKITITSAALDRFIQKTDMGKFGWITTAVNGQAGWTDSIFQSVEETPAEAVAASRFQHPFIPVCDWKAVFDKIDIARVDKVDDHDAVVVELTLSKEVRCLAFVDRETGRVLKMEYAVPIPGVTTILTTEVVSDWREIGSTGVHFPYRWEIENDVFGKTIVQIESIETGVILPASAFSMPVKK